MKLIYCGAEAELWEKKYLGMKVIEKKRVLKRYRIKEIDEKIRNERIKNEANMLVTSRKYVKTPFVYDVNLKKCSITLEKINGKKIRDLFYKGNNIKIAEKIGVDLRKLHDAGIIHNDLTTSNMILKNDEVYFIDFGLAQHSFKIEYKATDVLVFKKMLKSTHWKYFDEIWKLFKRGYADNEIIEKTDEIEKRARYT